MLGVDVQAIGISEEFSVCPYMCVCVCVWAVMRPCL